MIRSAPARPPRPAVTTRLIRAIRLTRARTRNIGTKLDVGRDFAIAPGAAMARRAHLIAGDRVSVGPRLTLGAHLHVGDDVMISANVGVIGDDHPFDESNTRLTSFTPRPLTTVVIEGDSLIGHGSTLIGPLTIGFGAVVGAGSLVTKDVPAGAVVAGAPARVLRYRRDPS